MSDLQRYIENRLAYDSEFGEGFEVGYADFKVGILLRQAREDARLTQAEMARRLRKPRSAISKVENHAEQVRLSFIQQYAQALGKKVNVSIT